MDLNRLHQTGKHLTGLDGNDWNRQEKTGSEWTSWKFLNYAALKWTGVDDRLDWARVHWNEVNWTELERTGLDQHELKLARLD